MAKTETVADKGDPPVSAMGESGRARRTRVLSCWPSRIPSRRGPRARPPLPNAARGVRGAPDGAGEARRPHTAVTGLVTPAESRQPASGSPSSVTAGVLSTRRAWRKAGSEPDRRSDHTRIAAPWLTATVDSCPSPAMRRIAAVASQEPDAGVLARDGVLGVVAPPLDGVDEGPPLRRHLVVAGLDLLQAGEHDHPESEQGPPAAPPAAAPRTRSDV